MRAVRAPARSKLASSFGSHSHVVGNVQSFPDDVVEVFTDDDVAGREAGPHPRDSQTYGGENAWLTIF